MCSLPDRLATALAVPAVSLSVLLLSPALAPVPALAQTSAEVAAEVDEARARMDAQARAVAEAQGRLSETIRDTYKSGAADEATAIGVILDTDATLESLITFSQYSGSLTRQQEQAVRDAQAAQGELAARVDELSCLREELLARESAISNRDDGRFHFCQWGESWSSLPYWGGGDSVGTAGCGLCSYTTMVDLLTGSDYDPGEMLALRGDWAGMEEQLGMTNGTPDGSTHREWTKKTFDIDLTTIGNTVAECRRALSEPETVLIIGPMGCTMHDKYGSTRWTNGHYVCVYRCDDGGFYMHDSAYSGDAGTAVYYTDAEMQGLLDTWDMVTKASN